MPLSFRARERSLAAFALAAAALALYLPAAGYPFLAYDDDLYVTANRQVLSGLALDGVRWAFTTFHASNWHPLTWLSHMLDVSLFGPGPAGPHVVNAVLHAANSALLFLLLARTTGAARRSACVAALFALHPLHVQSVAWVAERKDVLSTLFAFLAAFGWIRYAERPSVARYLPVAACHALGLMAKPMLVTLPVLLFLLDFWPLGRLPVRDAEGGFPWRRLGGLLAEKVPLILLSVACAALTLAAQSAGGATGGSAVFPLHARLGNAVVAYGLYAWKTLVPTGLAVFYPFPPAGRPAWQVAAAAAALAAGTGLALREAGRRPWLAFGWGWFLLSLVPVIGLVQVGGQAMADRYMYLPIVGLLVAAAWEGRELAARLGIGRNALAAAALLLAAGASVAARVELAHWRSDEALFGRALEVTEGNWLAHYDLGVVLEKAGRLDDAAAQYRETLRIDPRHARARTNLGGLLVRQGRAPEALPLLVEAVAGDPASPEAHNNLAMALAGSGRLPEAVAEYEAALRIRPDYAEASANLGAALEGLGRTGEAEARYREALRADPSCVSALNNLGFLLGKGGRTGEAVALLQEAVRLAPGSPEANNNLGIALLVQGRAAEAAERFREALRLRPGYPEARANLDRATGAGGGR
jgi:Flp pilus assembly protein TadD